jgi:p21-activated kinase 1
MRRALAEAEPSVEVPPMRALDLIVSSRIPPISNAQTSSPEMLDFLEKCLNVDRVERAAAEQLLAHPFLKTAALQEQMHPLMKRAEELSNQEELDKFWAVQINNSWA